MPPTRSRPSRDSIEQENRLLLAIQAIKKKEINSIRDAVRQFNVPRSMLTDRINGHQNRSERRANNHKMTKIDENLLKQWIISKDKRGESPRPTTVQEMANILLAAQGSNQVGKNWVSNFIQRTPELRSRFSRRYNYQRAKQEDPKVIREWFELVKRVITTYGILSEDI